MHRVVAGQHGGVDPGQRAQAELARPCSEVVISRAAEPSEICEDVAGGDRRRPSLKAGFSAAELLDRAAAADALVGADDRRRRAAVTGTICASNGPSSCAAAAFSCERERELVELLRGSAPSARRSARRRCPGWGESSPYRASSAPSGRTGCPPAADEPIGTRDIDSTPPATTRSYCPAITPAAAKCTDCWRGPALPVDREPGTDSGQPAASTACGRCRTSARRPATTQPQITSSTSAGSMPVRSASARSTCADRSTGWMPDRPPFALADRGTDRFDDDGVTHGGLRGGDDASGLLAGSSPIVRLPGRTAGGDLRSAAAGPGLAEARAVLQLLDVTAVERVVLDLLGAPRCEREADHHDPDAADDGDGVRTDAGG